MTRSETARRAAAQGRGTAARRATAVAAMLGAGFLLGQLAAWRALVAAGVSLATGPHSDFFYLLTGVHGLHLTGGLLTLGYAWWRAGRAAQAATLATAQAATLTTVAVYWHFVDVLWLYLLVILFWA